MDAPKRLRCYARALAHRLASKIALSGEDDLRINVTVQTESVTISIRVDKATLAKDDDPPPVQDGDTVEERMLAKLHDDPTAADWTAARWASELSVSASAVKNTPLWKRIMQAREAALLDRHDRHDG